MKRVRFTTILLLLTFCLLPILSVLMIHHLTLSDTLSKMGTGSFGESYSCISIKDSNYAKKSLINTLNNMKINYALCLDSPDKNNGTIREFYFNKRYANLPMESGRFFKPKDFTESNYVAVIGKGRKNQTYLRDNKQYINVYGKEYLVLGVIGYENNTVIDNYIFVNMFTVLENSAHMYLIDYFTTGINVQNVTENCVDSLISSGIDATVLTGGENYSDSIMPSVVSARWFIVMLISCFICLTLVSVQWINYQKKEICVRRLVGASIKDIVCLIFGKYILIAIISFLVGFVYCNILYPAYFINLLSGYAVCAVFIAFFMLWSVVKVLREPIEEAIK